MITDAQYVEFLKRLGADQRGGNSLNLTEWESQFLGTFMLSPRQDRWMTEGRRKSTDKMWMRYGGELSFPHPLDTVPEAQSAALCRDAATADGCEYLVRDDAGPQRRCNEPAVCRESRAGGTKGLRYCETHKEAVLKAFPKIVLIKLP